MARAATVIVHINNGKIKMRSPIIPGTWADPFVLRAGEDYYLYPTKDAPRWRYRTLHAFRSTTLTEWEGPRDILSLDDVSWADTFIYAPTAGTLDGRTYLYFCADNQIGLAAANHPLGPFRDILGRPFIGRNAWGCQSIDPDLFVDDDGTPFLLWGQGKCWIAPLRADMRSFLGEPTCLTDRLYTQAGKDPAAFDAAFRERGMDPYAFDLSLYNEGPHLRRIGERYLLSWSVYDARDPRYAIRYAWGRRPEGPYIMPAKNTLLAPSPEERGTGHGSLALYGGQWYLFYHRHGSIVPERDWSLATPWDGKEGTDREVCVAKIRFTRGEPVPEE
jgi:xylan 1,4-beta-xylosidase